MKLLAPIHDALVAAKLLQVLTKSPVLRYNKDGKKAVDRLRGYIDQCVIALVVSRDGGNVIDMTAVSACLEAAAKRVKDAVANLHPDLLVLGETASRRMYRAGTSNTTSLHVVQRQVAQALAFEPLESATGVLMAGVATVPAPRRGDITKAFGFAVRNAEWLSTLLALGVEMTSEDLPKYLKALESAIGSHQGRAQVAEKMAMLTGVAISKVPAKRSRRGVGAGADAADLSKAVVISVTLEPSVLANLPRVRELSMSHHDLTPRITDILQSAAMPVRVDAIEKVQPAIDAKLKAFNEGLDKRTKLIKAAQAKSEADAAAAQRARALEALKALGPLAQVLKDNPDLLKQI